MKRLKLCACFAVVVTLAGVGLRSSAQSTPDTYVKTKSGYSPDGDIKFLEWKTRDKAILEIAGYDMGLVSTYFHNSCVVNTYYRVAKVIEMESVDAGGSTDYVVLVKANWAFGIHYSRMVLEGDKMQLRCLNSDVMTWDL